MWGSVSRSRTLRHAAQPCPEPGFEPATFRSLVNLDSTQWIRPGSLTAYHLLINSADSQQACSLVAPSPCDWHQQKRRQRDYYGPQFSQDQLCSACKTIYSHCSNVCFSCGLMQWPTSHSPAVKHTERFRLCPGLLLLILVSIITSLLCFSSLSECLRLIRLNGLAGSGRC